MLSAFVELAVKSGAKRLLPVCQQQSRNLVRLLASTREASNHIDEAPPPQAKQKRHYEDLRKQFSSEQLDELIETFPPKFLNKKRVHPPTMYICHPDGAAQIAKHILKDLDPQKPLLEINPGPGLLTRHLVESPARDIRLFEGTKEFFGPLCAKYETNANVDVKRGDMMSMIRLSYMEGNETNDIFSGLPHTEWTGDVNFRMFGCVGNVNFMKYLINSVVFQTHIMALGRTEMMLVMAPYLYTQLTCDKSAGYLMYRSTSILFQIAFTHELIAKIPRQHFLPHQSVVKTKLGVSRLSMDSENMYLVKVVPRRDLFDIIPADQMSALWYFIRHNCVSRSNRIIPNLEKWVPDAGVHLILNQKPNTKAAVVRPNQLSKHEYIDNINIFTTFGDLSPSEMVTLYFQFSEMPGYKQSPFIAAMEMAIMKMDASVDSTDDQKTTKDPADLTQPPPLK